MIEASFDGAAARSTAVSGAYQYDTGQRLRLLGIPPGPLVGKAWRHLKEVRLDRGPLEHEEAVAELFRWAREQGLEVPDQQ